MARQNDGSYEDRLAHHVLFVLTQLERLADVDDPEAICLTSVRFKMDADGGTSVLCVLSGFVGERDMVAFVGGYDLVSCVMALRKKIMKKRLSWRESTPWGE